MGGIISSAFEVAPALPPLENPGPDEKCALVVIGVCESWTGPKLADFLKRSNLAFEKVQKSRGQNFCIIDFKTNEDRLTAYNYLAGCILSDNVLEVRPYVEYDPPPVPFATQEEIIKCSALGTQTVYERMYPFKGMKKEERLKKKLDSVKEFLSEIHEMPITIIESNKNYTRHNRVDLIVGYDRDGNIAVGYNTSSRINSTIQAINSDFDVPPKVIELANKFADFVSHNVFPPYDPDGNTGKWMRLSVRIASNQKTLVVISTSGGLPLDEMNSIEDLFKGDVDTLAWLKGTRDNIGAHSPIHTLFGAPFIAETLLGLTFDVYPFTVFPRNFEAYKKFLDSIIRLLDEHTVLVDLCCGAGVNAVCLAAHAKRVVGISHEEHSVTVSEHNAESNKIGNAFFVCGSPATTLPDVANNVPPGDRLVCLLDAAVPGLHTEALEAARACGRVSALVYASPAAYTLAYDLQRKLELPSDSLPPPLVCKGVEIIELDPLCYDSKVVGYFERQN